jgi:hypothetical protein
MNHSKAAKRMKKKHSKTKQNSTPQFHYLYTITSIETWKKKTKTQRRNSLHTKES